MVINEQVKNCGKTLFKLIGIDLSGNQLTTLPIGFGTTWPGSTKIELYEN